MLIAHGNPRSKENQEIVETAAMKREFNYSDHYPEGLDFTPGSDLHKRILTRILTRAQESARVMQRRYDSWDDVDRSLTMYIPLDEKERKSVGKDNRKPVSIVIPVSWMVMETILTRLISIFLVDPYFRYAPTGGEDKLGTIMLEKVIAQQAQRQAMGVNLYTQFRDILAYGFGVVSPIWMRHRGYKTVVRQTPIYDFMGNVMSTEPEKSFEESILYEGHKLCNIDPRRYLPDPNTPIHEPQRAEFIGWLDRDNVMSLLEREREPDSGLFNVRYLTKIDGRSGVLAQDTDERDRWDMESQRSQGSEVTRPVDVIYMYVNLIPREWKLGPGEYPEKWMFAVAGDAVVIQAQPLDLDHNLFPVAVAAPDTDGYTVAPISRMEVVGGLQTAANWLWNTHMQSIRRSLNGSWVVNPLLVNVADFEKEDAARFIRLRKSAWSMPNIMDQAVKQLDVRDDTASHVGDLNTIFGLVERVTGATEGLMGIRRDTSERVSSAEAQGTQLMALSRVGRIATLISMQSMRQLGHLLASQTIQLMSGDTKVAMTGRHEDELRAILMGQGMGFEPYRSVTPFDIVADYDVLPNDATMPQNENMDALVQIYQSAMQNPMVMGRLDFFRFFMWIAKKAGVESITDFELKTPMLPNVQGVVMPDDQIAAQAQAGNIMPVQEAMQQ